MFNSYKGNVKITSPYGNKEATVSLNIAENLYLPILYVPLSEKDLAYVHLAIRGNSADGNQDAWNVIVQAGAAQLNGEVASSDIGGNNKDVTPGGIDFDSRKIDMQIEGTGLEFEFPDNLITEDMRNLMGLVPVIINFQPVTDPITLLGPLAKAEAEQGIN